VEIKVRDAGELTTGGKRVMGEGGEQGEGGGTRRNWKKWCEEEGTREVRRGRG